MMYHDYRPQNTCDGTWIQVRITSNHVKIFIFILIVTKKDVKLVSIPLVTKFCLDPYQVKHLPDKNIILYLVQILQDKDVDFKEFFVDK